MGNFNFIKTKIKELYSIDAKYFGDDTGYFMESDNGKDFSEEGFRMRFAQYNESESKKVF